MGGSFPDSGFLRGSVLFESAGAGDVRFAIPGHIYSEEESALQNSSFSL